MSGDSSDSRKKRSLDDAKYNITTVTPSPEEPFPLHDITLKEPNITFIHKNETFDERDLKPYLASVVYFKTELVLSDLHHFQEYSIEV